MTWEIPGALPKHIFCLSHFQDIQIHHASGENPRESVEDLDISPPVLLNQLTKSQSRSSDVTLTPETLGCDTPSGLAILVEPWTGQVKVLTQEGTTKYRYKLPAGEFANLLNIGADDEYLYGIFWAPDIGGGQIIEFKQYDLATGLGVILEWGEAIGSDPLVIDNKTFIASDPLVKLSDYWIKSDPFINDQRILASDPFIGVIAVEGLSSDAFVIDQRTFESNPFVNDQRILGSDPEVVIDTDGEGISGDPFVNDQRILESDPFVGVIAVEGLSSDPYVLPTLVTDGEGISGDPNVQASVVIEGWYTMVEPSKWYCNGSCTSRLFYVPDDPLVSILLSDIELITDTYPIQPLYPYMFDKGFNYEGTKKEYDQKAIIPRRLVTSTLLLVTKTRMFLVLNNSRGSQPLIDTSKGINTLDRRTSRSVIYEIDPLTKLIKSDTTPTIKAVSGAFGVAASDGMGLCLIDCLWKESDLVAPTSSPKAREGNLVILDPDSNFDVIYDDPSAVPMTVTCWQQWKDKHGNGYYYSPKYVNYNYRGLTESTYHRPGFTIRADEEGVLYTHSVDSGEYPDYSEFGSYLILDMKSTYTHLSSSYTKRTLEVGKHGHLLAYSKLINANTLGSDPLILNPQSFIMSDPLVLLKGFEGIKCDPKIRDHRCLEADPIVTDARVLGADPLVAYPGYRTMPVIITNSSPVELTNQQGRLRFTDFRHVGTYYHSARFWTPGERRDLEGNPAITWDVIEESAMASTYLTPNDWGDYDYTEYPRPIQYIVGNNYTYFGLYRPFEDDLFQPRAYSKRIGEDDELLDGIKGTCAQAWPPYSSFYELFIEDCTIPLGGIIYKFEEINQMPVKSVTLPATLTTNKGEKLTYNYRHIGLSKTFERIYCIRVQGSVDYWNWAVAEYNSTDKKQSTINSIPPELLKQDSKWEDFFVCVKTWNDYWYPLYTPVALDSWDRIQNELLTRDIIVYDFNLNLLKVIDEIKGLEDEDVVQHIMEKNGTFYILTQVTGVGFDWASIPDDLNMGFDPDETEQPRLNYHVKYGYNTYEKLRVYKVDDSLLRTAELLIELPWCTYSLSDIVIQEITNDHVWINWDGVRHIRSGSFLGIGVKLDGSGYVEVPGLVAVVNGLYSLDYDLITYKKTTEVWHGNAKEYESLPYEYVGRKYPKLNMVSLDIYNDYYDAQSILFWGNARVFKESAAPYKYYCVDSLSILKEPNQEYRRDDLVCYYKEWYFDLPAYTGVTPGVSQFMLKKTYDWIGADPQVVTTEEIKKPTNFVEIQQNPQIVDL